MGIYIVHPGTGTILDANESRLVILGPDSGVDEDYESEIVDFAEEFGITFDTIIDHAFPVGEVK
jgi:hypothetical protein